MEFDFSRLRNIPEGFQICTKKILEILMVSPEASHHVNDFASITLQLTGIDYEEPDDRRGLTYFTFTSVEEPMKTLRLSHLDIDKCVSQISETNIEKKKDTEVILKKSDIKERDKRIFGVRESLLIIWIGIFKNDAERSEQNNQLKSTTNLLLSRLCRVGADTQTISGLYNLLYGWGHTHDVHAFFLFFILVDFYNLPEYSYLRDRSSEDENGVNIK